MTARLWNIHRAGEKPSLWTAASTEFSQVMRDDGGGFRANETSMSFIAILDKAGIPIPTVEGGSVCWWRNETECGELALAQRSFIILLPFPEFTNSKLKSGLYKVHHPIIPPHKVVF